LLLGALWLGVKTNWGCGCTGEPRPRQAKNDIMTIMPIAEKWQVDHAGACTTMEELKREKEISASSKITDPWQHVYRIECSNDVVRVSSDGPDGKPGTKDDITQASAPL
jgi:hypothetical protein